MSQIMELSTDVTRLQDSQTHFVQAIQALTHGDRPVLTRLALLEQAVERIPQILNKLEGLGDDMRSLKQSVSTLTATESTFKKGIWDLFLRIVPIVVAAGMGAASAFFAMHFERITP